MVIELVAGRIIAPYVGVSIYTWTSIIGVVMLGITLGNWVGGRMADRYPRSSALGGVFLLAAAFSAVIVFISNPLWSKAITASMSLSAVVFWFSLITFFPVAFFLSFITPIVIRLRMHDVEHSGRTVGNVYGWSSAGSILGTFLTGFWLVASFDTHKIVWAVFVLLAFFSFYYLFKGGIKRKLFVGLILGALPVGVFGFWQDSVCTFNSQYFCIRIGEEERSGVMGYSLILDALDHGYLLPQDVDPFGYDTFRLFATLVNYNFLDPSEDKFNVLVIGGGAYILPRYILDTYPNAEITVFEIDPKVTEINYKELGLERNDRLQAMHGDGRFLLNKLSSDVKYDYIFIDAFSDFLVPHHLATREFVSIAKSHLSENGIYFMHMIDSYEHGQFLSSNLLTVDSVFENTYFFPMSNAWEQINRSTLVVVGTDAELDNNKWSLAYPVNDPLWDKASEASRNWLKAYFSFSDLRLKEYAKESEGVVLTDSYAPVENMLAPLFIEQ